MNIIFSFFHLNSKKIAFFNILLYGFKKLKKKYDKGNLLSKSISLNLVKKKYITSRTKASIFKIQCLVKKKRKRTISPYTLFVTLLNNEYHQ